ncbi:MAG: hypothetical protein MZV65_28955 [Chromatiales bacterium]|nr:hypothetical protein [Chromatiales bacterium]
MGVFIARHYGDGDQVRPDSIVRALFNNPPLWSALAGLLLNFNGAPPPPWLEQLLGKLSAAVVPLMLISLGLGRTVEFLAMGQNATDRVSARFQTRRRTAIRCRARLRLGFSGDTFTALVLEAAMPSMLLGVVYCDRYRLEHALLCDGRRADYLVQHDRSAALALSTLRRVGMDDTADRPEEHSDLSGVEIRSSCLPQPHRAPPSRRDLRQTPMR